MSGRLRIGNQVFNSTSYPVRVENLSGGIVSSSTSSYQSSDDVAAMQDVVTARFGTLRNKGRIVNSPMTRYVEKTDSVVSRNSQFKNNFNRAFVGPRLLAPLGVGLPVGVDTIKRSTTTIDLYVDQNVVSELVNLCQVEARSRAAKADVQALVSWAERRETLELLGRPLELLRKRTMPFEKLRAKMARQQASIHDWFSEASSLWLTVRYGIVPLLMEVDGVVKALQNPHRVRDTGRARIEESGVVSKTALAGIPWTGVEQRYDEVCSWNLEVRAGVLVEFEDDLQARLGLRLADVPGAFWEATRLSFVADWFGNVGDFIESLTLSGRASELAQWATVRQTTIIQRTEYCVVVNSGNGTTVELNPAGNKSTGVFTRTTRTPLVAGSTGSVAPRFSMNGKRYVDAIALLIQRFKPPRGVRGV